MDLFPDKAMLARAAAPGSAPRDGGDDAHLVAGGNRGGEVIEVADVLVVDVDVHEPAELRPLEDAFPQRRELGAEVGEDLVDGGTLGFDDVVAAGVGAERGGDAYLRHDVVSF